jgi:beta-xylosidase
MMRRGDSLQLGLQNCNTADPHTHSLTHSFEYLLGWGDSDRVRDQFGDMGRPQQTVVGGEKTAIAKVVYATRWPNSQKAVDTTVGGGDVREVEHTREELPGP